MDTKSYFGSCVQGYYGQCSYPHGWITIFTQVFGVSASILSFRAAFGCDFLESTTPQEDRLDLATSMEAFGFVRRRQSVGVFDGHQVLLTECISYSDDEKEYFFDSEWRAGRFLTILASSLSLICIFCIGFMACLAFRRRTLQCLSAACLLASLVQATALFALLSDICDQQHCVIGRAVYHAIAACTLWLVTGCLLQTISLIPIQQDDDNPQTCYIDSHDSTVEPSESFSPNHHDCPFETKQTSFKTKHKTLPQ